MQAQRRDGKFLLTPQLVDFHQIREATDLPFDGLQTDVAVQLRQQVLQLFRRCLLLRCRCFFRFSLLLRTRRRLFPGRTGRFRRPCRRRRPPKIRPHPAQVVLRHGTDHLHLLENDLIFFALVLTRHVFLPDPNPC